MNFEISNIVTIVGVSNNQNLFKSGDGEIELIGKTGEIIQIDGNEKIYIRLTLYPDIILFFKNDDLTIKNENNI